MVPDRLAEPGGIKSARNERIRIIAFQNIQNFENRISLRKVIVSQRLKQNRKITKILPKICWKSWDYVHISPWAQQTEAFWSHIFRPVGSFVRIFSCTKIKSWRAVFKTYIIDIICCAQKKLKKIIFVFSIFFWSILEFDRCQKLISNGSTSCYIHLIDSLQSQKVTSTKKIEFF